MEKRIWFCLFVVFLLGSLNVGIGSGEKLETVDVTIQCLDVDCPTTKDNRTRYDHEKEASDAVPVHQIGTAKRVDTLLLYGTTAAISSGFALLTIAVQWLTCPMTHNAKVMLCFTISLFALSFSYALRIFVPCESLYALKLSCFTFQYVGALSTFFWMSVLAFDLWRVFATLQAVPLSRRQDNWRFLAKCVYAWGIPVLICIVAIIISLHPQVQEALNMPLTFEIAWFPSVLTAFIFFFLPLIIILLENIVFFLLTIINIKKASCGTEILNNRTRNQLFKVFLKLFLVMGLCWIMEIVSWLCINVFKLNVDEAIWYFTDIINLLQGFFIFLIYLCRKRTLKWFKKRLLCKSSTENRSSLSKSSVKSEDSITVGVDVELKDMTPPSTRKTA